MKMQTVRSGKNGFTLIEALIALAVMSFGLLAVATFQSKLVSQSGYNKARSEAVALAQEKLDQVRSFASEERLVANLNNETSTTAGDEFPANVDNGTYSDTPSGTNASYTRTWAVSGANDVRNILVTVSWVDRANVTQTIRLQSGVTLNDPADSAELEEGTEPLVPSATGRAHLGDGTADTTDAVNARGGGTIDNGDGTSTIQRGNDVVLIDNASIDADGVGNIVLTLEKACSAQSGVCTDFVKISGTVYRHLASAPQNALGEIYVLASDAAYCTRLGVSSNLTTSPSGEFQYYDYTCYLGGGWHGNIGLLMTAANSEKDFACVGDPTASQIDAADAWRRPELAKRRVYRGITYKMNGTDPTDPVLSDPNSAFNVATNPVVYYSQGIADAVNFPAPALVTDPYYADFTAPDGSTVNYLDRRWANAATLNYDFKAYSPATNSATSSVINGPRVNGHDFVVVKIMNASDQTATYCNSILAASTDTETDPLDGVGFTPLFQGIPNDFVCLNNDSHDDGTTAESYSTTSPYEKHPYLDALAVGHAAPDYCPYDPSDPPAKVYTIALNLTGYLTGVTVDAETSDGDTCTAATGTTTPLLCTVYDWEDFNGNLDGWNGYVNISGGTAAYCAPELLDYTSNPVLDDPNSTIDRSVTVTCYQPHTITLPVTSTVDLRTYSGGGAAATAPSAPCDFAPATDGLGGNITCDVYDSTGTGWTGDVTVTPPDGIYCTNRVQPFSSVTAPVTGSTLACEVDMSANLKVAGSIQLVGTPLPSVTSISMQATETTYATTATGTCSFGAPDVNDVVTYSCDMTPLPHGTWNVAVTYTTNKIVCTSLTTGQSPYTKTYSVTPAGVAIEYLNQDYIFAKATGDCAGFVALP